MYLCDIFVTGSNS